jgi:heme/copper-type cytochrome/quinol oxidase subunit 3
VAGIVVGLLTFFALFSAFVVPAQCENNCPPASVISETRWTALVTFVPAGVASSFFAFAAASTGKRKFTRWAWRSFVTAVLLFGVWVCASNYTWIRTRSDSYLHPSGGGWLAGALSIAAVGVVLLLITLWRDRRSRGGSRWPS